MTLLFRFLARMPLWLLHAVGAAMGWVVYLCGLRYRQRFDANLQQAGLSRAQARGAVAQAGRMVFELPRIWMGPPVPYRWSGLEHVERAYAAGKGVLFLTPHMGCFEITPQAMSQRYAARYGDLTVLYRPARQAWLANMMTYIRNRPGLRTAPTNLSGVRQMIKALRRGQAVGLLPDHVPPQGQGVWAPFFGKPAYSMTLAAKLVQQTGAEVVVVWGERLPCGRGFELHCSLLPQPLSADLLTAVTQINQAMEQVILAAPSQYMWSYARYRQPRAQPEAPAAEPQA